MFSFAFIGCIKYLALLSYIKYGILLRKLRVQTVDRWGQVVGVWWEQVVGSAGDGELVSQAVMG